MESGQALRTSRVGVMVNRLIKFAKDKNIKRKLGKIVHWTLRYTLMITMSYMILVPILTMISYSFTHPRHIGTVGSLWIPAVISADNFRVAWAVMDVWRSVPYTTLLVSAVVILQIANAALAGYAFARLRFKGMGILFVFALVTFAVPSRVLLLPQGHLFRSFDPLGLFSLIGNGPINLMSRPAVLFLMAGLGIGIASGLFIYIFRQFFRGLPKELEEAAYVDGAGVIRTFLSVVLPMAKPGFLTVGVLSFIWNWNDTHFVGQFVPDLRHLSLRMATLRVVAGGTPRIHQYIGMARRDGRLPWSGITVLSTNPYYDNALLTVCTLITILPLLILFLIIQRQFVQGVERSGIVG